MPHMNIDVDFSIDTLAEVIKTLSETEWETLAMLLSDRGQELLTRKEEIEKGKVEPIAEAELFDD